MDQDRTPDLLSRAQDGDEAAAELLCGRILPRLCRWASGRLPVQARGTLETGDLVQSSLLKTLGRLASFEPQHRDALVAYLHTAVLNLIRDELRRTRARPEQLELADQQPARGPSPLDDAVGQEVRGRYLAALERLGPRDRSLLLMRIEMDLDYPEIAAALHSPSADATRMAIRRAVRRLAEEMGHVGRKSTR